MKKVTLSLFHSLEKVVVPIESIQQIEPRKEGSIIQLPKSTLHIRGGHGYFFLRKRVLRKFELMAATIPVMSAGIQEHKYHQIIFEV